MGAHFEKDRYKWPRLYPSACNIYERAFLNAVMGYFIRNWGKRAPATKDGSVEKGNECTAAQGFRVVSPSAPRLIQPRSRFYFLRVSLSHHRNGKITTAV